MQSSRWRRVSLLYAVAAVATAVADILLMAVGRSLDWRWIHGSFSFGVGVISWFRSTWPHQMALKEEFDRNENVYKVVAMQEAEERRLRDRELERMRLQWLEQTKVLFHVWCLMFDRLLLPAPEGWECPSNAHACTCSCHVFPTSEGKAPSTTYSTAVPMLCSVEKEGAKGSPLLLPFACLRLSDVWFLLGFILSYQTLSSVPLGALSCMYIHMFAS